MISLQHKFIFIHIPKTGGSSFEHSLAPYSEDQITAPYHYDGVDMIEIAGISPHKHATLQDYHDILGPEELAQFKIVTIVRNPLERAISFYYSPHRWFKRSYFAKRKWPTWQELKGFELSLKDIRKRVVYGNKTISPFWDDKDFSELLGRIKPITDYLMVNGNYQTPDIVIRFENINDDVKSTLEALELPNRETVTLPHVNKSNYESAPKALSPALVGKITALFKEDFEHFGYELPESATPHDAQN